MHERSFRNRAAPCAAALCALLVACTAIAAERHEAREGDFILRSDLVAAGELDAATARRLDIPGGAHRAVLNVALVRASDGRNARAVVSASSRGPDGERQKILMREVDRGGATSYLGSFAFTPGRELAFVVEARPAEGADRKLLTLTFHERMPPQ